MRTDRPRPHRHARGALLALGVLLAVALAGCVPPADPEPPPPPAPTQLELSTNPPLIPAFDPGVRDYVVRCTESPVAVTIGSPDGTSVSVKGQVPQDGRFTVNVNETPGQGFTIVYASGPVATDYYVRCLPPDFPDWTVSRTGPTQGEYYITAGGLGTAGNYPAIFDNNGVPIWWAPRTSTLFAELLADGNVAWTKSDGTPIEERRLDGTLVGSVNTALGGQDIHDLLRLDNGNYVLVGNFRRTGFDFSSWGGPANAAVVDHIIQELTPAGAVVWTWDAADHISVDETDPQWRAALLTTGEAYDAYHWNSIEATPTGYILSFRHLDAVYNIDRATGDIVWKLGGTTTPQSLTVLDDPVFTGGSHFGGQHDARVLGDGTLTLFDDGTNLGRAPRGVRYRIDPGAQTATMLDQHTDSVAPGAFCCGSARRLAGGNWVIGWGGTNSISELTDTGDRMFLLQFAPGALVYRAIPVEYGVLSREALRAGMDAQYPSP